MSGLFGVGRKWIKHVLVRFITDTQGLFVIKAAEKKRMEVI